MTIHKRLKDKRQESGMTLQEVADLVGVSRQTIQRYESGNIKNIPSENVEKLADIYHTTPQQLYNWEVQREVEVPIQDLIPLVTKQLPLLGDIACGEPILADEHHGEWVETTENINADFCIRCKGDSMVGARIYDGDIVFIKKQADVENGEIAAVLIEDEATLKRVNKNNKGFIFLMAENPDYAPIVIDLKENDRIVKILGKAVAFQSIL